MTRSRRLLLAATVCGAMVFGGMQAMATDVDIDATLTATAAVTVNKVSDLDFGTIDFTASHIGNIQLGPDGNRALSGATNLTLSGSGAAAQIDVTSSSGTIDITCDATGIIDDGTQALSISTVVWDTSAATFGAAANTCAGLGTGAVSVATANPSIYIGAQLDIGTDELLASSGSTPFNTSTGTGNPVTFRFVYQ